MSNNEVKSAPANEKPLVAKDLPSGLDKMQLSYGIYMLLWILSLISATYYCWQALAMKAVSKELLSIVFGFITFIQLAIIYREISNIEKEPELYEHQYGDWIAHRREKPLRLLIFLSLLFSAGKITDTVYVWFFKMCKVGENCVVGKRGYWGEAITPDGMHHIDVFVFGACSVFICICVWNLAAFVSVLKIRGSARRAEWLTNLWKISCYSISTFIAFVFWILFHNAAPILSGYSSLLLLAYVFFAFFAIGLSFRWPRDKFENVISEVLC
jgi:hypothetical protein